MQSFGKRLRGFRQSRGKSQIELELEINVASGSISRFEADKVSPSRKTLKKISDALNLNEREFAYLSGKTSSLVSDKEITTAIIDVKDHFEEHPHRLGYLIDDRSRFMYISPNFVKFFDLSQKDIDKYLGMPILCAVLDTDFELQNYLSSKYIKELLKNLVIRFYYEINFMVGDEYRDMIYRAIQRNKLTKSIWENIDNFEKNRFYKVESRKVVFDLGFKEVELYYYFDKLFSNPRFEVIEYMPSEEMRKVLKSR
jgi:transcriptional regulator with XRE-family HTH domain